MTVGSGVCAHQQGGVTSSEIRLLIVDDHAGVREGLVDLLSIEDDLTVVGECENGSQVVVAAASSRPDVVLMDMSMPVMDGLTATRALLRDQPEARVIVLTSKGAEIRPGAEAVGARGLVSKSAEPQALLHCIRSVAHGWTCCPHCLSVQHGS